MTAVQGPRQKLLSKIIEYAAEHGLAGKSLRDIATGAGTSHRMVLYHFGSREGLLAALVADVERRQRELMSALATRASTPRELMTAFWDELSSARLRPFVRLFFEVVGLAAGGASDARHLLSGLTQPWLEEGVTAAKVVGGNADPAMLRVGVAVTRGLLLDLVAGADPREVAAAYEAFINVFEPATGD